MEKTAETYFKLVNGGPITLEEVRENFEGTDQIGITINLPRTKKFIAMPSESQKIFLRAILKMTLKECEHKTIIRYRVEYEYCKDGHVHLHGILWFERTDRPYSITGLLMDLDRCISRVINVALNIRKPYKTAYHDDFKRIRKPSHCLQYMKNYIELHRWLEYMYKQYSVSQLHEVELESLDSESDTESVITISSDESDNDVGSFDTETHTCGFFN